MTTVKALNLWDRGDEVKKMQNALKNAKYDIGVSGVDGIYGNDTQKALEAFQRDNGLTSKVADVETLNKLYGNSNSVETPTVEAKQETPAPTYESAKDDEIAKIYNEIMNRKGFTYDPMSDPLYGIMSDQYKLGGRMAMMDTMGQAANLTGGYGSSYGQMVGQQAYQGYLQEMNNMIPQLQEAARANYDAETERLLTQYQMAVNEEDQDYSRYLDQLNNYWQNKEWDYTVQQTERENLMSLIAAGYSPTASDLAKAGLSEDQAAVIQAAYAQSGSTGGGGGGGTPTKTWTHSQTKKLDEMWASPYYKSASALFDAAKKEFSQYSEADIALAIKTITGENVYEMSKNAKDLVATLPYVGSNALGSVLASETASNAWKEQALEKILNSDLSYEEMVSAAIELGLDDLL